MDFLEFSSAMSRNPFIDLTLQVDFYAFRLYNAVLLSLPKIHMIECVLRSLLGQIFNMSFSTFWHTPGAGPTG